MEVMQQTLKFSIFFIENRERGVIHLKKIAESGRKFNAPERGAGKTAFFAALCLVVFFRTAPVFSQTTPPPFPDQVGEFATAIGEALPFMSGFGLNWSTPYVGQLIGHPNHYGVGLFLGTTFTSNDKIKQVTGSLGMEADDSFMKGKQWFPNYTLAARIGGAAEIPFDAGFKIAYMPDMALWGSLKYHQLVFGVDAHYALFRTEDGGPGVSFGLGIDFIEGGAKGTFNTNPTGSGITGHSVGEEASVFWKSTSIKLKLLLGQPIWVTGFTVFGGLEAGYHISDAGIRVGKDKDSWYEDKRNVSGALAQAYAGLGLEINELRFDVSLMANFINLELGFCFGGRFQS
jgi:hypothetical protein